MFKEEMSPEVGDRIALGFFGLPFFDLLLECLQIFGFDDNFRARFPKSLPDFVDERSDILEGRCVSRDRDMIWHGSSIASKREE